MKKIAWWLVIIGGLNWGLVGLGGLFFGGEINLVSLIFGTSTIAYVVYLLVGLCTVYTIIRHCGCKKCMNGTCDAHKKEGQM